MSSSQLDRLTVVCVCILDYSFTQSHAGQCTSYAVYRVYIKSVATPPYLENRSRYQKTEGPFIFISSPFIFRGRGIHFEMKKIIKNSRWCSLAARASSTSKF
uniref:Uncharacterized protein n=1 Tax=Cacopsylla melanoneura TaxID=428564 RepID=A0A8D8WX76_9HEMI